MELVPTALTLCGLALGMSGAVLWPEGIGCALLVVSLLCDVADGRAARYIGCESMFGARLDWWTDIAIGNTLAIMMALRGMPLLSSASIAALVLMQGLTAWGSYYKIRTSGRTIVTALAIAATVLQ